jgi:hypothetical protein
MATSPGMSGIGPQFPVVQLRGKSSHVSQCAHPDILSATHPANTKNVDRIVIGILSPPRVGVDLTESPANCTVADAITAPGAGGEPPATPPYA